MNATAQRRQPSAPTAGTATPAEARRLAEGLMDVMNALLSVIEQETELVRAGKLREAIGLGPNKTELSNRYVPSLIHFKGSPKFPVQNAPDLLKTLHRHHAVLRSMLQVNLTVLAPAPAVSESIVRGVNA